MRMNISCVLIDDLSSLCLSFCSYLKWLNAGLILRIWGVLALNLISHIALVSFPPVPHDKSVQKEKQSTDDDASYHIFSKSYLIIILSFISIYRAVVGAIDGILSSKKINPSCFFAEDVQRLHYYWKRGTVCHLGILWSASTDTNMQRTEYFIFENFDIERVELMKKQLSVAVVVRTHIYECIG